MCEKPVSWAGGDSTAVGETVSWASALPSDVSALFAAGAFCSGCEVHSELPEAPGLHPVMVCGQVKAFWKADLETGMHLGCEKEKEGGGDSSKFLQQKSMEQLGEMSQPWEKELEASRLACLFMDK